VLTIELIFSPAIALAVFGKVGKLFVEVSVIGLNIGSCIAFFVIIGDLAPPIVAQATGLQWVRRKPNHHSRCLPKTATELVVQ